MLTAGILFNYVWQHFCSVFPEAIGLAVAYGDHGSGKVRIADHGLPFFEKKLPFPEQFCQQHWNEQNLPFLFETELADVLTQTADSVTVHADIVAGAFYFLSGWQEYHSPERDRFNRFPYKASLHYRHKFITLPVVNYYFDILRTALEKGYGISLKNQPWPENAFVTFLSHDVDHLESAWKIAGLAQLKQGNFRNVASLAFQKVRGRDHWHNLKSVAKTVKKYGAGSTFFWLAQQGKFQNHPNADYDLAAVPYQKLMAELAAEGFENGIHGSFGTSESAGQLLAEAGKLPGKVSGNRFHYLCYDPGKTPQVLTEAGISYDCSLGFAEHFGFRNSYCFPFRPFDFSGQKPYPFLEIPLNLMDTTLWHENYLHVPPETVTETLKPMLLEIRKFGGVFGLLWHNENFSAYNKHTGLAVFEGIMQELTESGSGFRTGSELAVMFRNRLG